MSILSERALPEIASTVISILGLSSANLVTDGNKFVRLDFIQLVDYFEDGSSDDGLTPPWVILRQLEQREADWGMNNQVYTIPIEVYIVQSLRNCVATHVTVAANNAVQTVASTVNMFVGQRLWFDTANVFGIIQSVDSPTQITLAGAVNTSLNEQVTSEAVSDVHVMCEKLKYAFRAGVSSFTNFQIVEDSIIDTSDSNPINMATEAKNYQFYAGSCTVNALVGETA